MKKKITVVILTMVFLFCVQPFYAAGGQETVDSVGAQEYRATVVFHANGGMGVMQNLTVASGGSARLTSNAFVRQNCTFYGWNTKADGTGTAYADQADISALAAANNGGTVTLYAQWKVNPPKIKKMTSTKPGILKVTFQKNAQAGGYEIQYAVNAKFTKAQKVTVKKSAASLELTDLIPGKTYYVRIRSYNSTSKSYGDWSASQKKKVKKGWTIVNAKSEVAIEADVTLSGSGTGYHAKLVICTPTSAVSYGIQYDRYAAAPYTGKAMALIENVASNNPGGQKYTRPGNKSLKLGKTYHLMMTMDKKGKGSVYLDYKKIGSFSNPSMKNQDVYLRVEGSARLNQDKVKAVFKNIRLKKGKNYDPDRSWSMYEFKTNKTLKNKVKNGTITISGRITGLPSGGDWDSCYNDVSDIIQFY